MRPKRIILVRHAQSEGNIDKTVYERKPDYALNITPKGVEQALQAGSEICKIIGINNSAAFYVSPFWRTRQTFEYVSKFIPIWNKYEDPRLREQEWGHKSGVAYQEGLEVERDNYGHFYYRFPDGESCADVFDRVSDFLNTLHRDFEKIDFPENCIIITHGMTLRVFLMRWLHLTVEEFEIMANPKNCEYHILELQDNKKYKLITKPRIHKEYTHPFQYPTK